MDTEEFDEEEEILVEQAKVKFLISWMCQIMDVRYDNCDYDETVKGKGKGKVKVKAMVKVKVKLKVKVKVKVKVK